MSTLMSMYTIRGKSVIILPKMQRKFSTYDLVLLLKRRRGALAIMTAGLNNKFQEPFK